MKRTAFMLVVCMLMATMLAVPTYAQGVDARSESATDSNAETLYYDGGSFRVYVGNITEVKSDNETRASYHTRRFDIPFYAYTDTGIPLVTFTAHVTTVGLVGDWVFQDVGTYTYETHSNLVSVWYWEPNTFSSNFIQAAYKFSYLNNEFGPGSVRLYADAADGSVSW